MMQSGDQDELGTRVLLSTGAQRRFDRDLRVAELDHRSMIPATPASGR